MTTRNTAVCGHPGCDPYERRVSVLDEPGDVVLYNACDGTEWVFRDDVCHGLILHTASLWKPGHNYPAVRIHVEGRDYVARWEQSKTVAFRHDTYYGLIAKVARKLLVPAACCRGDAL